MRSILMKAQMARAVAKGLKTQTRRLVKGQPKGHSPEFKGEGWHWTNDDDIGYFRKCPYGVPGDRIWVKEPWKLCDVRGEQAEVQFLADQVKRKHWFSVPPAELSKWQERIGRTYIALHMPRWASRCTLSLTDVRVEKLQQITASDARAEGLEGNAPRERFRERWEKINGVGSWEEDPWVWVLDFETMVKRCS